MSPTSTTETRPEAPRRFFAACTLGVEAALIAELTALGVTDLRPRRGGVEFRGPRVLGYRCCLWLRSAIRVQEELIRGRTPDEKSLYNLVQRVDWSRYMTVDQTLAVNASIRDSFATDPRYPALLSKDAIVDQFRKRFGRRPSVDRKTPTLPLRLALLAGETRLYRDLCGPSLHKRGYRPLQVKSPLNEALAAALLLMSDWDRTSPLLDPMCGSGTFAIEAALLASDRAPGLSRDFPFQKWPDFDAAAWRRMKREAIERAAAGREKVPPIEASDRHSGALGIARRSAEAAGMSGVIRFTKAAVDQLQPSPAPACVVVNPPYGERIGRGEDLEQTWRDLGDFLHRHCQGARAFVLSGNKELTRHLHLHAQKRHPVRNGPLDCRWIRYDVGAVGDSDVKTDAPK